MTNLRDEALSLAEKNIPVFPLRDKKPVVARGFHSATTDPEQIKAFPWANANGIGAAVPDGQFVIDIDPRHNGDATIEALEQAGLEFPETRIHGTKSGGEHRFYLLPPDNYDARLKGQLGPGVDVKAAGRGYVVVPPTPGYSVQHNGRPSLAPDWLVEELVKQKYEVDATEVDTTPKYFPLWENGTRYGLGAAEAEIESLANTPRGARNNALNRAAFSLAQLVAGGELKEEYALQALATEGDRTSDKLGEVEATIKSGWEAGIQEPRTAPDKEDDLSVTPGLQSEEHFWLDWENADDSPPPFYCHPILPKNAYVIVYGPTEASKSIVLLGLAAEGSHAGVKSSIYSLENPSHIDIDRVRRIGPNPENFRITNQIIDMNDPAQVHALIEREKSWGTDIVILDTYSHAFNSRSEDGNAKAIEFAIRVRYVMQQVGCTVVIVDHTGYADHGEPRDASAKRQQVDVAIKMERTAEWRPGEPSRFSMTCTKSARFGNPHHINGAVKDGKNRTLYIDWAPGVKPEWVK